MYSTLKLIAALALVGGSDAFLRVGAPRRSAVRVMMSDNSEDLGFTPWKPKENQGFSSTDTPDFFEEDTVVGGKGAGDIDGTKQGGGTALSELMQTDSWTIGGREAMADRPDWFTATPMSVPDGTLNYAKSGQTLEVTVENGAMGYEDFYADFSDDTQGSWEVEPVTGTLNRRGQDPQDFQVVYKGGASGTAGHLIIQTEEEKFSFELVVP